MSHLLTQNIFLDVSRIHTRNMSHILARNKKNRFSHILHIHTERESRPNYSHMPCFWCESCPTYPHKKHAPHTHTHSKFKNSCISYIFTQNVSHVPHSNKRTMFLVLLMSHISTKEFCPTYLQTPFFWDCCVFLKSGNWTLVWVTSHVFTQNMSNVPHTHTYNIICMSHVPHIHARYAACPIDPNIDFCFCNGAHE